MAFTISFAMIGSLIVALQLFRPFRGLFRGGFQETDNFMMRPLKWMYKR